MDRTATQQRPLAASDAAAMGGAADAVDAAFADAVYAALLGREREAPEVGIGAPVRDFVLDVIGSAEFAERMARLEGRTLTSAEAEAIFQELIGRPRDDEAFGVGMDRAEFVLAITSSSEYAFRAADRHPSSHLAVTDTPDGPFLTAREDQVIGGSIRSSGAFQENEVAAALEALRARGRPVRGGVFLDIGANIGTHSVFALRHGFERAICFEADADNFRLLRANQVLNGLDHRATNHRVALAAEDGTVTMERSPFNHGDHRVRIDGVDAGAHGEGDWSTVSVPARRLDGFVEDGSLPLDAVGLAWIDTQGYEGHILSGAGRLLEADIPMVIEFWPYGLDRTGGAADYWTALERSGRRVLDMGRDREVELDELRELFGDWLSQERDRHSPHTNLLLY